MPKTKLGKLSVFLILAFVILFFIGPLSSRLLYKGVRARNSILTDIFSRPVLVISMLLSFVCAITAMIVGFISVIKQKERSPLVYTAISIGLLLSVFLVGEIVGSH